MARAAAAARATAPAPRHAPRRPTRRTPAPRRGAAVRPAPRPKSVQERLAGIQRSPFVDRLLTGRIWIVLIAGLLAGIVFANVALLEMNAGIARTTEKVAALKRENARLRLQAARLGSTERIQRAAADIGLVLPAPGQVRYLEARPGEDAALAVKRMSEPEPPPVVAPVAPVTPVAPVAGTTDPAAAPVATAAPPATTAPPATVAPPATGPAATTSPTTPGATG